MNLTCNDLLFSFSFFIQCIDSTYLTAKIIYLLATGIAGFLFLVARHTYVRDNRYRQQLVQNEEAGDDTTTVDNITEHVVEDMTDKQNNQFIYRV